MVSSTMIDRPSPNQFLPKIVVDLMILDARSAEELDAKAAHPGDIAIVAVTHSGP